MRPNPKVILKTDIQCLLMTHGVRAVLAELAGELYEQHLGMAYDHPEKWLFHDWSNRLETMAEQKPKAKREKE